MPPSPPTKYVSAANLNRTVTEKSGMDLRRKRVFLMFVSNVQTIRYVYNHINYIQKIPTPNLEQKPNNDVTIRNKNSLPP